MALIKTALSTLNESVDNLNDALPQSQAQPGNAGSRKNLSDDHTTGFKESKFYNATVQIEKGA